jgi:5-methylcytosine-specific restriction endonuclease McrA
MGRGATRAPPRGQAGGEGKKAGGEEASGEGNVIRIHRGPEPKDLVDVRDRELPKLRKLARCGSPASDDITGYQIASETLWKAQHYKCCYCEYKIKARYNDVEHYRPKGRADRAPGCTERHGYWWLAFTWKNLLFACPSCNRSEKNDLFPLTPGDTALQPEEAHPGKERPYLLDPSDRVNPVEHIQFERRPAKPTEPARFYGTEQWFARPREGSVRGNWTIHVCGLNDPDLVELRKDHIDQCVQPHATELKAAISASDEARIQRAFNRAQGMLAPQSVYVALTYDALRHLVPSESLARWKLSWPEPKDVGLPPRGMPIRRSLTR